MSARIRLVISDVDGTLVRKDKSLSDGVIAAVKRLHEADIQFSIISARPLSGIKALVNTLGITGPVGAFNGGAIADPDGTIITAERLPREVAERALKAMDLPWVTLWVFADDHWHTRDTDTAHNASEIVTAGQEPVVVKDFDALLDRVDKMVAVSDDEPKLSKLEDEVQTLLGDDANALRSQTYYLDITAPGAEKGKGVTAIAKGFGVPLDQVAVIGDGQNDTRMFKVAGLSFAVGNASKEVQAAADHVVKPNGEDGVADAIDRYILPAAKAQ